MNSEIVNRKKPFTFEDSGLLQSNELYKYVLRTSVFPREAQILKELRQASTVHKCAHFGTAPDAGQFMSLLLKLVNAKKTLELGVFTGYSLLLTALALPKDGKAIGIDIDRKAYEIGLPTIKKSGVEHKIEFVESQALPFLDKLLEDPANHGSFDFAFVDADKSNSANYHERLLKLVKVGGVILYDNTLWGGTVALSDIDQVQPESRKISWKHTIELNEALADDQRVDITQIALGDGMTLCRRVY